MPSSSRKRPVIGLTLDYETPDPAQGRDGSAGYSRYPWYAIRENYCGAVTRAGGLPLPLPHEAAEAEAYLDLIDGLIVTGGHFDVDPAIFGAAARHPSVTLKENRTAFELAVTEGALKRGLPLLGICGGLQLLNVVLGGTLIQHIPDEIDGALAHEQPNPRHEPGHSVAVEPGTLLHRLCGMRELAVNSAHHQAVKEVGPGVVVNARAADGVIEGIEAPARPFCLGVQWHPEFGISAGDGAILAALVAAAAEPSTSLREAAAP